MPQRRARRCSASAAVASRAIRSRSQRASPGAGAGSASVVFEPLEKNHPIAFLDSQFEQLAADTRPLDAAAGAGLVDRAVGRAYQVAPRRVEKYPFLPVELHRDVRAAVEVGVRLPLIADRERGRRLAEVLDLEAHAAS